jgi:hypothetical protein
MTIVSSVEDASVNQHRKEAHEDKQVRYDQYLF